MRIPVPPEMPESLPSCSTSCLTPLLVLPARHKTQNQLQQQRTALPPASPDAPDSPQTTQSARSTPPNIPAPPIRTPRKPPTLPPPSRAIHSAIPRPSVSNLPARSTLLKESICASNAIAASFVRSLALVPSAHPSSPAFACDFTASCPRITASTFPVFSLRSLCLCVSFLSSFPFQNRPTTPSRQAAQASRKDSPPPAAPQHPAAIGHSRCRRTHSTAAKSSLSSAAIRRAARTFASPNIASLKIFPVHFLSTSSSRVAQT